jgi:hypothetical protein
MTDAINTVAKYLIAGIVAIGCLLFIYQGRGDEVQAWLMLGLIVGWLIRDSSGNAATANMERLAAAQPTVTTGGNPPRTVVTPPDPA